MPFKKQNVAAVLHSQLSTILEKLLIVAVEEMKELVFDFCEEISRERAENTDLCETTGPDQEEQTFDTSDVFYVLPQSASTRNSEPDTQTSREDAKEKHSIEQKYMKFPVTNDFSINAQETLASNFKVEESATSSAVNTQEEDSPQEDCKESNFEPPEDTKGHLIDYNSVDETQSSTYEDFPTNQGLSCDVECHIKQEEETPGFETGHYTGFQMQTSHMETGVHPIGQETLLINQAPRNTSFRVAPVPLSIPGPVYTNSYIDKRYLNKGNSRALPHPNKVLFKCEYCNKTYLFPSLLKAHLLKHTEGKKLVCGYCGKCFKWEYSLRRHEKMHIFECKS